MIRALLLADVRAAKNWFATQSISKLLVITGFMLLLGGVSWVIYRFSQLFFLSLVGYEAPGLLTANYILHAGLLIISWFAVGSVLATTYITLLSPNRQLRFLVSLPINISHLISWVFSKSVFTTFTLFLFTVFPAMIAYSQVFHPQFTLIVFGRIIMSLLLLTLITTSLGVGLAYLTVKPLQKLGYWSLGIATFVFIGCLILLFRVILPPQINGIADNYQTLASIYSTLPLASPILPTTWIITMATTGISITTLYIVILTLLIVFTVLDMQSRSFLRIFQSSNDLLPRVRKTNWNYQFSQKFVLIQKDWLSLRRVPTETGYALFLLSMAIFFFILISRTPILRVVNFGYRAELIIFIFLWLTFFTTAFLLRLVFPLMAREGKQVWYFFTLPLAHQALIKNKVFFATLVSLPYLLLALVLWLNTGFTQNDIYGIYLTNGITVVFLVIGITLLGCIRPQFQLAADPEKVSTSTMGMSALGYAIGIIAYFAWMMYTFVTLHNFTLINIWGIFVALFIQFIFYRIACSQTNFSQN